MTVRAEEWLRFDYVAVAAMRCWLYDCFDDLPDDLSAWEIIKGVKRHCDGTLDDFLRAEGLM